MIINFEKWQGCQNDFILLSSSRNETKNILPSLQRNAPALCSRLGEGIGADGILVLVKNSATSLIPEELLVVNRDGSLAENCGNGLRCAAASIFSEHRKENGDRKLPLEAIELALAGSLYFCRPFLKKRGHPSSFFSVSMGPSLVGSSNSWDEKAHKLVYRYKELNKDELQIDRVTTCSIANPHVVIFVKSCPDMDFTVRSLGKFLQSDIMANGVNVHLVAVSDSPDEKDFARFEKIAGGSVTEFYDARVWERGVGYTRSCGSGACAIAATVFEQGLNSEDEWIGVRMPGGTLFVKQGGNESQLLLAGEVQKVFEGAFDL